MRVAKRWEGGWGKSYAFPLQRGLDLGFSAPHVEAVWRTWSCWPGRCSGELFGVVACSIVCSPRCLDRWVEVVRSAWLGRLVERERESS